MPRLKVGDRAGVICGKNEDGSVSIFGYGTYLGDKVPPPGVIFLGLEMCRVGHKNPCIRLDNGDEVFGCESWFGSEERVRQLLDGKTVREVQVTDVRRMNREQYTEDELAELARIYQES